MAKDLKGLNFPLSIVNGGISVSSASFDGSNVSKINQNIMLVLGTDKGERTDANFGFSCRSMVFKNFNQDLINYYKTEITESIEYAIDSINITNIDFISDEIKNGIVTIRVYWKFKEGIGDGVAEVML